MDTDLILTLGIVMLVLSLPSLLSAWVDGRAPRVGAILCISGIGAIVGALMSKPGGYAFNDVPSVIFAVLTRAFQ
jgi:hypothetical protein